MHMLSPGACDCWEPILWSQTRSPKLGHNTSLYDDSMVEIYIHDVCIDQLIAASLLSGSPASPLHLDLDLHLICPSNSPYYQPVCHISNFLSNPFNFGCDFGIRRGRALLMLNDTYALICIIGSWPFPKLFKFPLLSTCFTSFLCWFEDNWITSITRFISKKLFFLLSLNSP